MDGGAAIKKNRQPLVNRARNDRIGEFIVAAPPERFALIIHLELMEKQQVFV
jgi:hypothetical protein